MRGTGVVLATLCAAVAAANGYAAATEPQPIFFVVLAVLMVVCVGVAAYCSGLWAARS